MYFLIHTWQNQYNARPTLGQVKYCVRFQEFCTYLRNNILECDQMSNERSSLIFILKLYTHVSLLLYIPPNNAGEKIIAKTFNILDSDPVYMEEKLSRGWNLCPTYPSYPGRANFSHVSLQNPSNRLYAKHKLGSAGGHSLSMVGSPFYPRENVLLCIHFGSHARVSSAKCRFTEHARALSVRKKMEPKSKFGSN